MIRVACAVIRNEEEEVLVVQRGEATDHPFKWEFPGGKRLQGETDEECIIREVGEELSMEIVIYGKLPQVEYDYGHKQIILIPFICDTLDELPFLTEHLAFKWLAAYDLNSVDFSEADVIVAKNYLATNKARLKPDMITISESSLESSEDEGLQAMVNNMMSMQEADWLATSAIDNHAIFKKLFEYSFSSDKKLAFRASWTLSKVCDKFPEIINPYLIQIVDILDQLDNESVQRSFLRILSFSDLNKISKKYHGILAEHCFMALRSRVSAVAIKAYSMEILYNLALIYPELANELSASISMLKGEGSAGILARGTIILKKLAQLPGDQGSSQQ